MINSCGIDVTVVCLQGKGEFEILGALILRRGIRVQPTHYPYMMHHAIIRNVKICYHDLHFW